MRQEINSFYILQVSDFHISEDSEESAKKALKAVTDKINEMNINIRYLIHTGDIINSKDINQKIQERYGKELEDKALIDIVEARVLKGALPSRQLKLILAWCVIHQDELMQNWELSKDGLPLNRINPLV